MIRKGIFAAAAAVIVFAGCSLENVPTQPPAVSAALSMQSLHSLATNVGQRRIFHGEGAAVLGPVLYVGNYQSGGSNVLVFSNLGRTLKRTVALPYSDVEGVTVDTRGNLFAASGNGFSRIQQSISVFKDAGAKAVKTLQQRFPPESLTVDAFGNLFVGCGQASRKVCQHPPAKRGVVGGRIVRRLKLWEYGLSATRMTTDASGDLAVSDQNHVSVFAPGAQEPYLDLALGLFVGGVAFDQSGNLYVPTLGYYDRNEISVYAPGNSKPIRSFSIPSTGEPASVLAFDAAGNLYALLPAEDGPAIVLVFAANGSRPIRTITKGLENFRDYPTMAVDAAGDIYVADRGSGSTHGSIVVYAANQSKPRRVITTGVQSPDYIAVGR